MKRFFLFFHCHYFCCANVTAQDIPALTLENIYHHGAYNPKGIRSLRWMSDNQSYSCVEENPETKGFDIVQYHAATGERTVLVPAERLLPSDQAYGATPLHISDYVWSEDQSKLLIFTNTKRVWRYHTRGDYWVLDLESGLLKKLGKDLEPSLHVFAKFSPNSKK